MLLSGNVDGIGTHARFQGFGRIAYSPDGSYTLVADTNGDSVRKIVFATRKVTTMPGTGGGMPLGIAISPDGQHALFTDRHRLKRIDLSSNAVEVIAGTNTAGSADGVGPSAKVLYYLIKAHNYTQWLYAEQCLKTHN